MRSTRSIMSSQLTKYSYMDFDFPDWLKERGDLKRSMMQHRRESQERRYVACALAGVITAFVIAQYL